MRYKETGTRNGSRKAIIAFLLVISFCRVGTLPQSFRSSLNLQATARLVELAFDKEND